MRKESGYRRLYGTLKRRCKERNLFLDLSYELFKDMIVKPCHYCGAKPVATNNTRPLKDFPFNGLDRVDNKQGYYDGNVVSCCPKCNSMKSSMSTEEFMKQIKLILKKSNS